VNQISLINRNVLTARDRVGVSEYCDPVTYC